MPGIISLFMGLVFTWLSYVSLCEYFTEPQSFMGMEVDPPTPCLIMGIWFGFSAMVLFILSAVKFIKK